MWSLPRSALEGTAMVMSAFLTRVDGRPGPAAEIADLAWWPEQRGLRLAPAVHDAVILRLRAARLLAQPGLDPLLGGRPLAAGVAGVRRPDRLDQ